MIRSKFLLGIIVTLISGCGSSLSDEPNRRVVQGTVFYNGNPITKGLIRFVPIKETVGPISSAHIQDGSFAINHKGGVPLGQHQVQIEAYRPSSKQVEASPIDEEPPVEQYLPPQWNSNSRLEFRVEAGNVPIQHEFSLSQ